MGRPHDTAVITGVVVRKGLAHRKMRSYIEYPKVGRPAGGRVHARGVCGVGRRTEPEWLWRNAARLSGPCDGLEL